MIIIPILVGGIPTPVKNMSSSVGMMEFPTEWEKVHVPNHQPDYNWILLYNRILWIING